ncbi:MAG: GNAT family N-acetyltransferase [Myxococcota bacterium]
MYRTFEERDADGLARAQAESFGFPLSDAARWWDTGGRENLRVWDEKGVKGGLLDIPMGLFVSGRRLELGGVAGVAVVPEARGRGIAKKLMSAYLLELAERKVPLSALYASTRGLYRSVGYGIAGNRYLAEARLEGFRAVGDRSGRWRPVNDADWDAMAEALRRSVPASGVNLDRGPYLWKRVKERRGTPNLGYVLEGVDGPDGWLVVRQTHGDEWLTLHVEDWWARTPAALRHVAGMLSTFGTMARTVNLPVRAVDPLFDQLTEHRVDVHLHEPWLLRICDVRGALEGRGWPSGLSATLDLEVSDPQIRDNNGRFRVRIANGEARVQAGSDGTIKISVLGLAGLYTGHASPWALELRGLLSGPAGALETLGQVFAGPGSAVTEMF